MTETLRTHGTIPDILMYDDTRDSFDVRVTIKWLDTKQPVDLTPSETVTVSLHDNHQQLLQFPVDNSRFDVGVVSFTVEQNVYELIGRYAVWRLYETGQFDNLLLQGRLVKVY